MLNKKTPLKGVYESHTLCNNAIIIRLFKLSHLMFEFADHRKIISMKIVQEENLQHVEHQLEQRYQLEPMSCLFFALGMLLSAYGLHYFVF